VGRVWAEFSEAERRLVAPRPLIEMAAGQAYRMSALCQGEGRRLDAGFALQSMRLRAMTNQRRRAPDAVILDA
jgi:hypothetical protein